MGQRQNKNFWLSYLSAFLTILGQGLRRSYKKGVYFSYYGVQLINLNLKTKQNTIKIELRWKISIICWDIILQRCIATCLSGDIVSPSIHVVHLETFALLLLFHNCQPSKSYIFIIPASYSKLNILVTKPIIHLTQTKYEKYFLFM